MCCPRTFRISCMIRSIFFGLSGFNMKTEFESFCWNCYAGLLVRFFYVVPVQSYRFCTPKPFHLWIPSSGTFLLIIVTVDRISTAPYQSFSGFRFIFLFGSGMILWGFSFTGGYVSMGFSDILDHHRYNFRVKCHALSKGIDRHCPHGTCATA